MKDGAGRSADHQADGVGNAVIDRDWLDVERAEGRAVSVTNRVLDHAPEHAVLLELDRDQPERQRSPVDRDWVVRVELHDQVRQPADVVFVAVGEQDPKQAVESLGHVAVIAYHQVNAMQLCFGELDPGVDDDHVLAKLDERRIFADLTNAAQRTDAYARMSRHAICQIVGTSSGRGAQL